MATFSAIYIICYFYIKNDYFLNYFFDKILAKYSLKRTKFKNFLGGACPRTPLANTWLRHALHGTLRHANTPTFPEKF